MFSIKQESTPTFEKVILTDDGSSTSATIIPACGGMLHAFNIKLGDKELNIIDSYDSTDDFHKNLTDKGFKGSKLSPFVCRMEKGEYDFAGQHYKTEKFYLGDHAIHGLIYDAAFTVLSTEANDTMASVTLKHEYRSTDNGYPFDYDCIVNYTLEKENRLSVTTTIINQSVGLIPVQDGWHPYFTFGGSINDLQFEFQSKEMVEFDDTLVPTGKLLPYQEFGSLKKIEDTFLDNCFTLNFAECQPMCVLRDPVQRVQVEIHPDRSYPYLQIYTSPHRNSIAIENLSGAPDGFNNGMGIITLIEGGSATFKTVYKITSL